MVTNVLTASCQRRAAYLGLVTLLAMVSGAVMRAQGASDGLPPDIATAILKEYGGPDLDVRYVDGAIDLNGDGRKEIVVYVVGGGACGTGGCPTLVYTPDSAGYRRVGRITVTNPPIRASETRTQGWRNLIVYVRGGGQRGHDAEVAFNGKTYAGNPTVASAQVKPAGGGGEIVIKVFDNFTDAKPLRASAGTPSPEGTSKPSRSSGESKAAPDPPTAGSAGPSFECAKATTVVEKAICGDPKLASLDRQVASAYTSALGKWDDQTRNRERASQRAWMAHRDRCAKSEEIAACIAASYQQRAIELQIKSGQLTAPKPVSFVCKGRENEPFTIAYYSETDPSSAVITMGDRQAVALAVRSGSGAHYVGPDVDFWEHQGEASVTWTGGAKMICKPR